MRPRERVFLEAGIRDPRDMGIGRRPAVEKFSADRMADEADVGERDRIAAAKAPRDSVVGEMRFQRLVAFDEPVPDPLLVRKEVDQGASTLDGHNPVGEVEVATSERPNPTLQIGPVRQSH